MSKNNPRNKYKRKFKNFEIVYEDTDLVVVNKRAGILSVPFSGAKSDNVLTSLNKFLDSKHQHASVVHRIDRYTSGLIIYAKHERARDHLVKQFIRHSPKRTYIAIVRGAIHPRKGSLIHYMRLSKNGFKQMIVGKHDREATQAKLDYKTLAQNKDISVLEVQLDTGLKNQIRVQFAAIGYPIVGDRHYNEDEIQEESISRQALHAWKLGFIHPRTNKPVEFEAPLDYDLINTVDAYGLREQLNF